MARRIFISGLLVLLILTGCSITPSEIPRITPEDLKERLDNGEDIVVGDTRSGAAYKNRHIAGAISISSSTDDSLNELAQDQEIVLYCA